MSNIKPCPFCGKEMTLRSSSASRVFIISHKRLSNCLFFNFEIPWGTATSFNEAIALWNRRAETRGASE